MSLGGGEAELEGGWVERGTGDRTWCLVGWGNKREEGGCAVSTFSCLGNGSKWCWQEWESPGRPG